MWPFILALAFVQSSSPAWAGFLGPGSFTHTQGLGLPGFQLQNHPQGGSSSLDCGLAQVGEAGSSVCMEVMVVFAAAPCSPRWVQLSATDV